MQPYGIISRQQVIIGSGNGLLPIRQQDITWTNDDPVPWSIYVHHQAAMS